MAHLVLYHGLEGLDELEDVHTTNADAASDYDASEPSNASEAEDSAARSDPGTALVPFDPALAVLHTYLGECADLNIRDAILPDGHRCRLPVLHFTDVVLMPGSTLPLLVCNSRAAWVVERAASAPPPYTGLIAVVQVDRGTPREAWRGRVGTTALVRKLQRDSNGIFPPTLKVLAEGCQRFEVAAPARALPASELQADVRILADAPTPRVPDQAAGGAAHWAPRFWAPFDAWALADAARARYADTAPQVSVLAGDPVPVSYWLARNLPLPAAARQTLLEAPCAAARLRAILRLLGGARLRCAGCRTEVALAKDALRISDEGTGGIFVNSSGFVHDMVALRCVRAGAVALQGEPTEEHSWFPGFAWAIACCARCGCHLGWQFTSRRGQSPSSFFGLRRQALLTQPPGANRAARA